MVDPLVNLLTRLNTAFKKLRLYPPEHSMCAGAIDAAMEALVQATSGADSVTFGLAGTTAVHQGAPLVELGTKAQALLDALASARIRWVRLEKSATRDDVVGFLSSLLHQEEFGASMASAPHTGIQFGVAEASQGNVEGPLGAIGEVLRSVIISFRAGGFGLPMAEIEAFIQAAWAQIDSSSPALSLLELAMSRREYMVRRGLLTCAISMALARKLGVGPRMCEQVGLAGLLADVALFRVDEATLATRHGGPEHIPRWMEHPSEGARILAASGAPSLAVVVAAEHHWGLKYASPARHPASSLVGLVDALVGHLLGGFGAPAHRLDLALIRLATEGTYYPSELLRAILDMSGLFVKGARVRLSNRQKGEIVTPNPQDPLRPEVLIDGEAEGMRLVDLSTTGDRLSLAAVLEE